MRLDDQAPRATHSAEILALGPSCVSPTSQLKRERSASPEFAWIPGNLRDLSKGYFAPTFLSSSLTCPATQSGLYQPKCRLDLNGKPECSMAQVDAYAVQNYRELARDGDCGLSLLVV